MIKNALALIGLAALIAGGWFYLSTYRSGDIIDLPKIAATPYEAEPDPYAGLSMKVERIDSLAGGHIATAQITIQNDGPSARDVWATCRFEDGAGGLLDTGIANFGVVPVGASRTTDVHGLHRNARTIAANCVIDRAYQQ